ncbi:DUF4321 domain-containing protein [candidate division KSB1 bacterium]|nr:DUF4321 domain-containing protein [candidate division KSB1 bacterium]
MRRRPLGYIIFILFLGAMIGTTIGELIALLLPQGVVEQFFLRSAIFGFEPFTINLGVFVFTFGFSFKLNVIGIIGIALAAYILRWYRSEKHY